MSEPPTTPSSSVIPHSHNHHHHQHQYLQQPHHHHHHHPHHQPLPNAQPQSFITPTTTTTTTTITHLPSSSPIREYRKGNWTLPETLVLITAKKLDDERRTKASITPPDPTKHIHQTTTTSSSTRTAELRWKWVENYCWNNGCLRSQNQCNDKWDNLLRDYKKVREYESRSEASSSNDFPSYWKLEKHERKERNLPTNLLLEVFEALNEVVHRRYNLKTTPSSSSNAAVDPHINIAPPPPPPPTLTLPSLPPPPPPSLPAETTESSETKQSERVDSDTKRRRKGKSIGTSVMKSASVLAQTLMNCEQNKEKRHRDIIELEERRLQIEEARNEVNRQGIAGLITAVNNLSGAIQTLVSDRHNNAGTGAGTGTGT